MKRCPTCNRTFIDDTQQYCLDDGASLIEEKASPFDAQATLVIPGAPSTAQPFNPYLPDAASQGSSGSGSGPGSYGSYGSGSGQGSAGPSSGYGQQAGSWTPPQQQFSPVSTTPAKKSMLPWILGGAAVVVIGIIGLIVIIAIAVNSSSNSNKSTSTNVVVLSDDGKIQVSAPPSWKKSTTLNDNAELQLSDPPKELYLIVLTTKKSDYPNMDLDTQASGTLDTLAKAMTTSNKVGPSKITIDGNPALQYEMRGVIKGLNVVYLHTTVETSKNFQQIVTWTMESTYPQTEDMLKGIIHSFKENSP